MTAHAKKWRAALQKASPASGFRPETEAEWKRLQLAQIEAAFHLCRANGIPRSEAKRVARMIHGGKAGRILLEIAFGERSAKEGA
jgi:hypothetical protein